MLLLFRAVVKLFVKEAQKIYILKVIFLVLKNSFKSP